MTASNQSKQSGSVADIAAQGEPSTTSWDDVQADDSEVDVAGPTVADGSTPLQTGVDQSSGLSTVTSQAVVPDISAPAGLETIETHELAERRSLSWAEMLRETELALRQAEDFRRTLRELDRNTNANR